MLPWQVFDVTFYYYLFTSNRFELITIRFKIPPKCCLTIQKSIFGKYFLIFKLHLIYVSLEVGRSICRNHIWHCLNCKSIQCSSKLFMNLKKLIINI